MKLLWSTLVLTLCFLSSTVHAQKVAEKNLESGFLIDPSKPYVYLEFDHVGPRKPLRHDEPHMGIWLHLKNNCRVPIVIMAAFEIPSDIPGKAAMVVDEVVGDPHDFGGDGVGGGILALPGAKEMTDIVIFPNRNEAEVRSAEKTGMDKESAVRPYGYNLGYEPLASALTIIAPGKQVLFSVPANHVSETWHFEIPFRFALPNKSRIRPPYSYVAFYQEDLDRALGKAATPTTH
jgi:hypothetical protein